MQIINVECPTENCDTQQRMNEKKKKTKKKQKERKKTTLKRTIVCLELFLWLLSFVILHFATCDYFGNGRYGNLASKLMLITVFRLFAICGSFFFWLPVECRCDGSLRFVISTIDEQGERSVIWPQNKEPNTNATTNKNYSNKFPFAAFCLFLILVKTKRNGTERNEFQIICQHCSVLQR